MSHYYDAFHRLCRLATAMKFRFRPSEIPSAPTNSSAKATQCLKRNHRSSSGFTLMEMLTVMAIIAVFSSISLPTIDSLYHEEVINTSAAELVADIRMARAWALENQTYVRIVFNPDGYDSWVVQELTDATGEQVAGEITFPMIPSETDSYDESPTYWRSIIDDLTREIDSSRVEMGFVPAVPPPIFFRPDGLLVSAPKSSAGVIGTIKVKFFFDTLEGVEVDITPSGAIESVAYYDESYL